MGSYAICQGRYSPKGHLCAKQHVIFCCPSVVLSISVAAVIAVAAAAASASAAVAAVAAAVAGVGVGVGVGVVVAPQPPSNYSVVPSHPLSFLAFCV